MNAGYEAQKNGRGTTLVELVIAMAILVIVLGAIVPVFAGIRNGSDTQQARTEMLQNARVLNEHLLRHLAQAKRIVEVSPPAEVDGYLEFETADGSVCRYSVNADGYVEFGPVGAGAELAGPLDCLRFVCYDANDLSKPIDSVSRIGFVIWEATLRSSARLGRDRVVNGACCLRANGNLSRDQIAVAHDYATRRRTADAFGDDGKPRLPQGPDAPSDVLSADGYDAIESGGSLP